MVIHVKETGRAIEMKGDIWYREKTENKIELLINGFLFSCESDTSTIREQNRDGLIRAFDCIPNIWPSFADPLRYRFKRLAE